MFTNNDIENDEKNDEKKTTRFYSLDFMEKKLNDNSLNDLVGSTESIAIEKYEKPEENFRKSFGPFLCILLLTSLFTIILGTTLLLAGYYVPRLTIQSVKPNEVPKPDDMLKVINYNTRLKNLRTAGITLLATGIFGLVLLFLTPTICLHGGKCAKSERCGSISFSRSLTPITCIPTYNRSVALSDKSGFSVIRQHIQPKKQKQQYRKIKQNYDKGFLSPELNRGPIFVSDTSHSLSDRINSDDETPRNRSQSEIQLSPNIIQKERTSSFDTLRSESRGTPVKAGSFYSLQ